MSKTWLSKTALVASVAVLVGCDHATKVAAAGLRDRAPLTVVRGVVELAYTENRDVAFNALSRISLHPSSATLAAMAALMTAVALAAWVRRRNAPWPVHVGFAFVVAGALGNVIDRLAHGHVVDFIHVRYWPVFNVADVLVVAGVALLFFARDRRDPARLRAG
jgi:signal peptidase II